MEMGYLEDTGAQAGLQVVVVLRGSNVVRIVEMFQAKEV